MNSSELGIAVSEIHEATQKLRTRVNRQKKDFISNVGLLKEAKVISETWFKKIKPQLESIGFPSSIISEYDKLFKSLMSYGHSKQSRKNSIIKTLESIRKSFKRDIIIAVESNEHAPLSVSEWSALVPTIAGDEKEYLEEAFFCAEHKKYRASVVLIWCAAVDRIHRTIEKLWDFPKFSNITEEMARKTKGEYKHFRLQYEVENLGEIRNVPDKVTIFSLRHGDIITPNQYKKLKNCLDYRNLGAHPGVQKISKQNLASVISDLNEVIFDNSVFKI